MADRNRNNLPSIAHTEQYIQNWGFDEDFNMPCVEVMGYDPIKNAVSRVTIRAFGDMGINHIDAVDSSTTYIGSEDLDGTYCVQKKSISGTVTSMEYATIKNNAAITTYADAWANRLTLTYNIYSIAF